MEKNSPAEKSEQASAEQAAPESATEHSAGEDDLLSRPVRDLELSIRSENCLLRGGIHTIGDLRSKSREDLLKIRNLGKISLKEIEEKMEKLEAMLTGDKGATKSTKED